MCACCYFFSVCLFLGLPGLRYSAGLCCVCLILPAGTFYFVIFVMYCVRRLYFSVIYRLVFIFFFLSLFSFALMLLG